VNEFEVLIIGGGPAGAAAALNLAPSRHTVVVDARTEYSQRIGESLPPVAGRLFSDMGLLPAFLAQGHTPCFGNRSSWGQNAIIETDFLRDPDDHGWHLDRARFDSWLRDAAVDRGAEWFTPARLTAIERNNNRWVATLATSSGERRYSADVILDASGRSATAAHLLGSLRRIEDRLTCRYIHGREKPTRSSAGFSYIQATKAGWWYTAPLPNRGRVLAFHTDADLPAARLGNPESLIARALEVPGLAELLTECEFAPNSNCGFTAAHSAVLKPSAGDSWVAAGDAAMSFDPLSGQGLLNALFTGLSAARAIESHFAGSPTAFIEYEQTLTNIWSIYRQRLGDWYYAENRWPHATFWRRRRTKVLAALARASPATVGHNASPLI